jgi:type VI secretion system secreted protein VgrG
MPRTFKVTSAAMPQLLGFPALELQSLRGQEGLSQVFQYLIRLITPDNPALTSLLTANVNYKPLVGNSFTVSMDLDGGGQRHITGLVTRARFVQSQDRRGVYEVVIEPWLTLASRTSDFKIFQNKSALDIVREVLGEYGFPLDVRTSEAYPSLDFQVQYGETDLAFCERLMSEWGMYYFFEHESGIHRMVLVDAAGAHQPNPGRYALVDFYPEGHKTDVEYADQFEMLHGVQPGQWVTQEFDFRAPKTDWKQTIPMPRKTAQANYEHFSWPSDAVNTNAAEPDRGGQADMARHLTRVRMEQAGSAGQRGHGAGMLRGIVCGHTFTLKGHPHHKCNGDYLVISNSLELQETGNASGDTQYFCRSHFTVQPASDIFRAPYPQDEYGRALKPRTHGPQTAIVTGPPGREIHTDKFGRVKVSFHWNRYCTKDQNSSCWVRVASPWAGTNFGGVSIPRIGQEVIVDFESGDPDRPIIIGRVYNQLNMPPWELPGNQTQSGMLTRSTEGGGPANANALRFEDMKGKEEVWLHAEKDQRIEVENDESHWVGRDRTKTIDRDETNHIKRDRTETVDGHEKITIHKTRVEEVDLDESITVHKNQSLTVDLNRNKTVSVNETAHIGANWTLSTGKNKSETVGMGYTQTTTLYKMVNIGAAYNLNVGAAMMTNVGLGRMDTVGLYWTQNTGTKHSHSVGDEYQLTVGAASLVLKSDGTIVLKGKDIQIAGSGNVDIKASGNMTLKATQIDQN